LNATPTRHDVFVPNGTRVAADVRLRSSAGVRWSVLVPGVDSRFMAAVMQLVKQCRGVIGRELMTRDASQAAMHAIVGKCALSGSARSARLAYASR
jgi:hypothetical protein